MISLSERLDLLGDIEGIGFWQFSLETGFLEWNKAMFSIYEIDKKDFNNSYEDWKKCVLDEDIESAEEAFEKCLQGGTFNYQFRIKGTEGIRMIKANATSFKDENGNVVRVTGVNIDVTSAIDKNGQNIEDAAHYKAFIEQSPNAIAMFNRDMEYLSASQKWLTDYGIDYNVMGKSHYEVFPEIGEDWKEIHRKCLKGHIDINDGATFIREDGSPQHIRWHVRPWRYDNNEIGGLLMFTEDKTELYLAQKQRDELTNVLTQTQNLARIGAWKVDLVKGKVKWDDVTREIHEVEKDFEPNLEQGISFYKEGFSRDEVTRLVNRAVEHKESFDFELILVTAKKNEIWVRSIGKPIVDEKGEVVSLSGLFQDIDDVKRKEIELDINRKRFEGAFEKSAIGMALISLNGHWLRVNDQCTKIFGYEEAELKSKTFQELTHPDDLDADLELLENTIKGERKGYQIKKRYINKDGKTVHAMLSTSLVRDSKNKPLYFVSQIEDVTKRVVFEAKLKKANKELQRLTDKLSVQNKSLSDFAHITSHNLRSPVGSIVMLQEMLEETDNTTEKKELIGHISSATKGLKNTLDELVEALVIREKSGDEFEELVIEETIDKVLSNLEGIIKKSKAKVYIEKNDGLSVMGNRLYFESILQNLISNAIKYSKADENPEIRIQLRLEDNKKIISIKDNGLGIDLKKHGNDLFGLNKTFHNHSDAKGVGLFMVKTQVESMGGRIKVESEPNVGSTFKVIL